MEQQKLRLKIKFLFTKRNKNIYVPLGSKHRLSNPGDIPLIIIIEVQSGDYLGEDDIIEFDDNYGRAIK